MGTSDPWASGVAYEAYVGRWSRLVAADFLKWLAPVPGGRWLDVGCGTGALTKTILDGADPTSVRGEDPSEAHIEHARAQVTDDRAEFAVGDARSIGTPDNLFDHVVSALVINFVPEPELALAEMARVAKQGAVVASYVWDYSSGMEMMRHFWDAATELDPAARELDEGVRFPLCAPGPLRALWESSGLSEVSVEPLVIPTVFEDFDDYWTPFLGGQGPAPGYTMSLPEGARARLRETLRERLAQTGTPIALEAKAWAVSGRV